MQQCHTALNGDAGKALMGLTLSGQFLPAGVAEGTWPRAGAADGALDCTSV